MVLVFGETEKLGRLVAADRVKCAPLCVGAVAAEPERRQDFAVKNFRAGKVFYPQINVVEASRFHFVFFDFRFSRRIINFNPDQVLSTAHTFVSTNPSGKATSRITSSVTSVETPADFFGQDTHTIPVSRSW